MSGVHAAGTSLRYNDYVHVGVECEIAVQLASDLMPSGEPFTADDVATAIDAYHPAIEIVDDRYADWRSMDAPTLIADDFFAAGCVLGAPVARGKAPDLLSVIGRAVVNGIGSGARQWRRCSWSSTSCTGYGLPTISQPDDKMLRAGDFVLTGSLVQTAWLNAGDHVRMELLGLGSVEVDFKS